VSKRDRAYKRSARVEAERARKETEKMIKRIKKTSLAGRPKRSTKKYLISVIITHFRRVKQL